MSAPAPRPTPRPVPRRRRLRLLAAVGTVLGVAAALAGSSTVPASLASLTVRSGSLSFATSTVSVPRAAPTLTQAPSAGGPVGATATSDSVTLTGGTANASGTLTVRLWSDAACTVAAASPAVVGVAGANGVTYPVTVTAPTVATTYRWTASYSGDADNEPAASVCGAPGTTVTLTAGPAATLAFTVQPGGGRVGTAWPQQPVVAVRDAFGNPAAAATPVTLTIATDPTAGVLTCAANPVAAVAGVAAFADCRIGTAGTGYTLTASIPGLTGATSAPFDVTAGVAYVATGPVATSTANATTTVAYPSGTAAGDLLLLVVVTANSSTSTVPAGWTPLADQSTASGSDRLRLMVWWRPGAAGESSVAVGLKGNPAGGSAWVVRYARPGGAGPAITAATAAVPQGVAAPAATLVPSPDVVTSLPGATVVSIVAVRQPNALSANGAGSVLRNAVTSTPTGGAGVALAFADRAVDASGTVVAAPTWTQLGSPGAWAWTTVAFG